MRTNKKDKLVKIPFVILTLLLVFLTCIIVMLLSVNGGLENEVVDLQEKLKDNTETTEKLEKAYNTHIKYLEEVLTK